MKRWVEQKVRRYEHKRWAEEPNRRVLPFSWGLEHIGGSANEGDPRGFLKNFVEQTIARSDEWFDVTPAEDYELKENVLTFTSAIASPWRTPAPSTSRSPAQGARRLRLNDPRVAREADSRTHPAAAGCAPQWQDGKRARRLHRGTHGWGF